MSAFNRNFWGPLRYAIMPYGMKRDQKTGLWMIFGRDYQVLADNLKFDRIASVTLQKLSHDGRGGDSLYFYDDGCTPESSKANMKAYQDRMERLMKLSVRRDYVIADSIEILTGDDSTGKSFLTAAMLDRPKL